MVKTICFYIGRKNAFNIQMSLANIGRMLSDNFDLHLITTRNNIPKIIRKNYKIFGPEESNTVKGCIKALDDYLEKNNPSLISHLVDPLTHGTLVGLLARKYKIPFVYRYSGDTFGSYTIYQNLRKAKMLFFENILGRFPLILADYCITMGPKGRERLTERGVCRKKVTILPPPIYKKRFETNENRHKVDLDTKGRSIIMYIGRLEWQKGVQTLERTIPKVLERREDVQFVLVGEKNEIPKVPGCYSDYLTILGPQPPNLIPAYLRKADLLVHPSLTEGIPRTILEALFCETPVVARDVGDVSYATKNTFTREKECVQMISNFEGLELDDPSRFSCENLKNKYLEFFENVYKTQA